MQPSSDSDLPYAAYCGVQIISRLSNAVKCQAFVIFLWKEWILFILHKQA